MKSQHHLVRADALKGKKVQLIRKINLRCSWNLCRWGGQIWLFLCWNQNSSWFPILSSITKDIFCHSCFHWLFAVTKNILGCAWQIWESRGILLPPHKQVIFVTLIYTSFSQLPLKFIFFINWIFFPQILHKNINPCQYELPSNGPWDVLPSLFCCSWAVAYQSNILDMLCFRLVVDSL